MRAIIIIILYLHVSVFAGAVTNKRCSVEDFACNDGLSCISFNKRCDNVTDCKDGSDEHHCDLFKGILAYTVGILYISL